eukprot:TRINITY_DN29091_c0_g1_i1.p1 TRINITY_DN29091_c0_g1~~TRINITY_DN29091_c0_g1_i1.p1  ORF type:complete len:216 (-),score=16.86 TRINITY_DN29091_c0_g1_i1:100-681(-)
MAKFSDDQISAQVRKILRHDDPEKVTLKQLRRKLEVAFGTEQGSFESERERLTTIVQQVMEDLSNEESDEEPLSALAKPKAKPSSPPTKRSKVDPESSSATKKSKRQESDDEEDSPIKASPDGGYFFYLDQRDLLRASVRKFKGSTYVDIRKFYTDKASGEEKPTQKGVSMKIEQYETLKASISKIDQMLKKI